MRDLFTLSHLNDLLVMTWMLVALTLAYRPRVKTGPCVLLGLLCLGGGFVSILLQEALCPSFVLYMLLFVVCGCVYSAAALKGSLMWKTAMAAVYTCIVFQLGKVAGLASSWLPESIRGQGWPGVVFFQVFSILSAVFLARHAVTTQRKVPAVCWASLMSVALIGIVLAYFQMLSDRSLNQGSTPSSALYSVMIVTVLLIVQHLCAQVIRSHEQALVRLSLEQSRDGEARMARQVSRSEEELRRCRHETMNHISSLLALLDRGQVNDAKQMLLDMRAQGKQPANDIRSGNALVDAIVREKAALCRRRGIDFTYDLVLAENLPLTDVEMSSLLENLLSNALEAAEQCQSPFVRLRMYPSRDYLCIESVNSADNGKLRGNPGLRTTKSQPELHGIGLKIIEEIAQRHHGMAFFDTDTDSQFSARVMIRL